MSFVRAEVKNNILQLLGGFIGLEQTLETQFTFCPNRIKKLKREKLVLPSELFQNIPKYI